MEREQVYINYKDIVPPLDWDFLSDDGRIVSGPKDKYDVLHCAMYVDGILTEFSWQYNSHIVIVSTGQADHIAERLNKEMCDDEILGGDFEAVAVNGCTICFYKK